MLLECSPAPHQLGLVCLDLCQSRFAFEKTGRQKLPIKSIERGFRVKRVDLTGAALQEHENDVLGFSREIDRLGGQRIRGTGQRQAVSLQKMRERQTAES